LKELVSPHPLASLQVYNQASNCTQREGTPRERREVYIGIIAALANKEEIKGEAGGYKEMSSNLADQ
jgi:hypothetical protein